MAEGGPKARRRDGAAALLRQPERLWHEHRRAGDRPDRRRAIVVVGAGVRRLRAAQAPRPTSTTQTPTFMPQKPPASREAKTVNWPIYGLNPARTRYLPAKGIKPPFRKLWRYTERPLLEFPPIYVGGKLYFVNNNGTAFALDADTGKGSGNAGSAASTPPRRPTTKHRLYIVNLVPGHIVKLDAKTGKTIWKRSLPGRAESSPVVIGRTVYFGCEDGNLYALSTISGNVRWATQLGGPVKSAPAYYGGTPLRRRLRRLHERGRRQDRQADLAERLARARASAPRASSTRPRPSPSAASTPATTTTASTASTSATATLAWSYSTGGYAYSGPTVANTRHSPPTVYIGSFDGNVYALDAKDGSLRWSRSAGGQVIGSLSAVGDIVYVAEFTNNSTSGFMMRSGRKRLPATRRGTYSPVISDGRRIYLTGYSSITALQPYKYKRAVAPAIVAPKSAASRTAVAKRMRRG